MRKYLLPKEGNFYKANLHMHTTVSDGKMTPEETKKAFKEKGYSIVAFTDHEVMVPQNDLTDENFLAFTSTEISINQHRNTDFNYTKCYHLNFYSRDPKKSLYNTFDETILWLKHAPLYVTKEQAKIKYRRVYSVDCINEMIKMANEEECLVSLNHPFWSLQDYSDYIDLKGLWGVEWHNTGCVNNGFLDTITPVDDLLRKGENVVPLATDDAHNINDCFGGFVMVKAPQLKHEVIYDALKAGDLYSSQGPLIEELYLEDNFIHVKTSKAKRIFLTSDKRFTKAVNAKNDEFLTEAKFDLSWYFDHTNQEIIKHQYIRITVVDEAGLVAHSRAYHLHELV